MEFMRNLFIALVLTLAGTAIVVGFTPIQSLAETLKELPVEDNRIKSIHFRSWSKNWSAFCSYDSDSKAAGAHLSGNPPFVHQENETVSKEAVDELWKAAAMAQNSVPRIQIPNPVWISYEQIDIIRQNDSISFIWQTAPIREEPESAVNKLKDIMLKYHIGGW
jgi:hypothetical protein